MTRVRVATWRVSGGAGGEQHLFVEQQQAGREGDREQGAEDAEQRAARQGRDHVTAPGTETVRCMTRGTTT